VAAIATVRAAYEQALAGALERRGLPATVGAAFGWGGGGVAAAAGDHGGRARGAARGASAGGGVAVSIADGRTQAGLRAHVDVVVYRPDPAMYGRMIVLTREAKSEALTLVTCELDAPAWRFEGVQRTERPIYVRPGDLRRVGALDGG
jgi:hypothetical protein